MPRMNEMYILAGQRKNQYFDILAIPIIIPRIKAKNILKRAMISVIFNPSIKNGRESHASWGLYKCSHWIWVNHSNIFFPPKARNGCPKRRLILLRHPCSADILLIRNQIQQLQIHLQVQMHLLLEILLRAVLLCRLQ